MARSDEFAHGGYDVQDVRGPMAWTPLRAAEAPRHADPRPRRAALLTGGILGVCAYAASIAAFAQHAVVPGAVLLVAAQVAFVTMLRRRRRAPGQRADLAPEALPRDVADVPEAWLARARQRPPSVVHVAPDLELSMN